MATTPAEELVHHAVDGPVATITLDSPHNRNALSRQLVTELAEAGVPVIPTVYVTPGETWTAPGGGEWVVKPTVSAGSQDTGRYRFPAHRAEAEAHVARLTGAGRTAMIQPYLTAVDSAGETAVLCLPDASGALTFSHAIRKGAMLTSTGGGISRPRPLASSRSVTASGSNASAAIP